MDVQWIIIGVFAVLLVGMILLQTRRSKAMREQQAGMLDRLRPGMRVKTVAGVIGRIREIREENSHLKTILLETGQGSSVSFLLYDINAVMAIMEEVMTSTEVVQQEVKEEAAPAIPAPVQPVTTFDRMKAEARGETFDAAEFVEKSNTTRKKPASKKS